MSVFIPRKVVTKLDSEAKIKGRKSKLYKQNSIFTNSIDDNQSDSNNEDIIQITRKERKILLNTIRDLIKNISNLNIKITKNSITSEDNTNEYIINPKEKIKLTYLDTLNPFIFPWYLVQILNLTPYEAYIIYKKELVPDEYSYNRIILKKNISLGKKLKFKQKRNSLNEIVIPVIANDQTAEEANLYCYCKGKYPADFMISKIFLLIFFRLLL